MGEKEADPWVVPLPPPGVASTLPPSQGGRALANKTPTARPFGLQLTCACKGPASGLSPGASTRVSESVPAQSEADPQEGTPGGHCLPEGHQTKTHKPHRGGLPTRACRPAVLCPGVPASTRLSRLHRRDLEAALLPACGVCRAGPGPCLSAGRGPGWRPLLHLYGCMEAVCPQRAGLQGPAMNPQLWEPRLGIVLLPTAR